MKSVRITFKKIGRAVYISHLDMNRFMTRAVRLAKLPIWYTEGFNPHPYITFAQPLSLGFASECELLDMKLTDDIDSTEVQSRLSAVMPEGIVITGVSENIRNPKEIFFAEYEILYKSENKSPVDCENLIKELLAKDEITVMKKTKKGEKEFDLKPHIHALQITQDKDYIKISVVLPSSNELSVNPNLLITAVQEQTDIVTDDVFITKKALLDTNMQNFLD